VNTYIRGWGQNISPFGYLIANVNESFPIQITWENITSIVNHSYTVDNPDLVTITEQNIVGNVATMRLTFLRSGQATVSFLVEDTKENRYAGNFYLDVEG